MGMWSEWRVSRDRRRRAATYLGLLLRDPEASDIRWMQATGASSEIVARELTFAMRAIGLIVAERDALDDRTAADVAHQLAPAINREARATADLGRHWVERWRAYTAALAVRGDTDAPATRLARVLLGGAGVAAPSEEQLQQATQFVLRTRGAANVALREVFGVAALPEDIRPSALRG